MNKWYFLIYSIIIIIVIIVIIVLFNYTDNNDVLFLTKEDSQDFINKDEDNYIRNMSIYDLRARKVNSNDEYKKLVIRSCLDFTNEQKEKLKECSKEARKFFNNNHKWIFSCIDNNYEEGFPHTRNSIIFLSPNMINHTNETLTATLIHESVHIYQRYNKEAIQIYLNNNNYTISRKKENGSLIRANPDLDEFIYKDKNGEEMVAYYSSEYPKGINDITLKNYKLEHPYELMAYQIAEEYSRKVMILRYKDI